MNINCSIATQTLLWLEQYLDEAQDLTDDQKGQLLTLINFWRTYSLFTSD